MRALLLSPRRVVAVLAGLAIVLHALNVVAQAVRLGGSESTAAAEFVRLFQVNAEGAVPTWYSAATLLLCAALLGLIAWATDAGRRYWVGLAAIFTLMSIDEAAGVHDGVSSILQPLLNTGGAFYHAWVIPAGVLLVVFAIVYWRFLWMLPPRTRRLFVAAGAIYVGGSLGMELVGALYKTSNGMVKDGGYAAIASFEEVLEMGGVLLFIHALLDHLRRHGPVHIPFPRLATVLRTLLVLVGVTVGLGVAGQVSLHFLDHGRLGGLVRLFHLDGEGNVVAWLSSMLLLAIAGALLIAGGPGSRRDVSRSRGWAAPPPPRWQWATLAAIFTAMSLDEFAVLHEVLNAPLRESLATDGIFYFAWVIPGFLFAACAVALYTRFLFRLPRATAGLFVLAGGMYVGGALGLELVGARYYNLHGGSGFTYEMIVAVEETLELAGLSVFAAAIAGCVRRFARTLEVRVGGTRTRLPAPGLPVPESRAA